MLSQPHTHRVLQPWTETLETMDQNNSSPIFFSQVFVTVMGVRLGLILTGVGDVPSKGQPGGDLQEPLFPLPPISDFPSDGSFSGLQLIPTLTGPTRVQRNREVNERYHARFSK